MEGTKDVEVKVSVHFCHGPTRVPNEVPEEKGKGDFVNCQSRTLTQVVVTPVSLPISIFV